MFVHQTASAFRVESNEDTEEEEEEDEEDILQVTLSTTHKTWLSKEPNFSPTNFEKIFFHYVTKIII